MLFSRKAVPFMEIPDDPDLPVEEILAYRAEVIRHCYELGRSTEELSEAESRPFEYWADGYAASRRPATEATEEEIREWEAFMQNLPPTTSPESVWDHPPQTKEDEYWDNTVGFIHGNGLVAFAFSEGVPGFDAFVDFIGKKLPAVAPRLHRWREYYAELGWDYETLDTEQRRTLNILENEVCEALRYRYDADDDTGFGDSEKGAVSGSAAPVEPRERLRQESPASRPAPPYAIAELLSVVGWPAYAREVRPSPDEWKVAEEGLGIVFPSSFKTLWETFGAGQWGGCIELLPPVAPSGFRSFAPAYIESCQSFLQDEAKRFGFRRFSNARGLLPWADTGGGASLCWDVSDAPPDSWPIIILGGRAKVTFFDRTVPEFLLGFLRGEHDWGAPPQGQFEVRNPSGGWIDAHTGQSRRTH